MKIKIKNKSLIIIALLLIVGGIFTFNYILKSKSPPQKTNLGEVTVFKSATCGCCEGYVDYLKREGFAVKAVNTNDLTAIKEKYKIPSDLESCHTAAIGDYFVEGHVPIEAINKLLTEKPAIDGIGLPGMPHGSPGMGGIQMAPFKIFSLSNGQASEFMTID